MLTLLVSPWAFAKQPSLSRAAWTAPDACPDDSEVEMLLDRALRERGLSVDTRTPVFEASIEASSAGFSLRLALHPRFGGGVRTLSEPDCTQLAAAAAAIAALAVAPLGNPPQTPVANELGASKPGAPSGDIPRVTPRTSPAKALPVKRTTPLTPVEHPIAQASMTSTRGVLPRQAFGASVGFGWVRGNFETLVFFDGIFPRTIEARAPARVRWTYAAGQLELCYRVGLFRGDRLSLAGCLGGKGALLSGQSSNIARPGSGSTNWVAGLAGLRIVAPKLAGPVGIVAGVDVAVPWSRPPFLIEGLGEVHRSDNFALRLGVGVRWDFGFFLTDFTPVQH